MRVLYAEAVYGEDEISAALNVLKNQPHSLMTSENVLKLESKVSDFFHRQPSVFGTIQVQVQICWHYNL